MRSASSLAQPQTSSSGFVEEKGGVLDRATSNPGSQTIPTLEKSGAAPGYSLFGQGSQAKRADLERKLRPRSRSDASRPDSETNWLREGNSFLEGFDHA